ncbi:MAG: hypothetical protein WCW27_04085 [Patescibacteria group bacterium]
MSKKLLIVVSTVLIGLNIAKPTLARVFNSNAIISDPDMVDYTTMSISGIQSVLTNGGGILGSYKTTYNSSTYSAAEIIYLAAQNAQLNPQFLLVQLQKESSLITSNNANLVDWAMGYGVCDSCSKDDPTVVKYKGFYNQMTAASNQFRNYINDLNNRNSTISGWGVGRAKTTLDGITITPENKATAALYTYTPWVGYYGGEESVGGNSLLFDLFERYFPDRNNGLVARLEYPDGVLFQGPDGSVFRLEHGALRPITSKAALLANYNPNAIINVGQNVLNRYEQGDPISYPKFILVQSTDTGSVFVIDDKYHRRAITSKSMLRDLGYNPEEIISVADEDLSAIPESSPLATADKYPLGALLQNKNTGAVMYFDRKQTLHPVISRTIIANRYKGYPVYQESNDTLKQYNQSVPVKLADGTLVKIPERNAVYVIDHGNKRLITSPKILKKLGGKKNILVVDKKILKLHPLGESY